MRKHKFFDEYVVGETFKSYARTLTEADLVNITNIAGLKPPVFIDEEWCKRHSLYGTRIMPGLFTAIIAAGMLEDILGPYTLAALGLNDFKFSAPVFPGDTLHSLVTVETKRDTSDGSRGILSVKIDVINQKSVTVLSFKGAFLFSKEQQDLS